MTSRRVLVTGSSRGIGKACALRLAADGFHVTVHYASQLAAAESVVSEICDAGGTADVLQFDVSNRAETKAKLEEMVTNNGAYYGVVCNAGFNSDAAFPAMTEGQWDQVVHGNLDGFYNVLQPLIMPMIKLRKGGRVVTMSSVSGLIGNRGQVNYSAAKAGIIGATKALSLELAKRNITVNCVAPGVIATDMTEDLPKEVMDAIPMKRVGSAEEVSAAVSYLCSDAAAYVTRQVIAVNGGLC
jgi:3-oxoacyl-[acyl-carrier protein] reductase